MIPLKWLSFSRAHGMRPHKFEVQQLGNADLPGDSHFGVMQLHIAISKHLSSAHMLQLEP